MRDAVIVSTARTPIGRAYKGAFNATLGPTLGAFSLAPAIERAGIEAGEIDDVVWGAVLTQGTQFGNIGRQVALRAGCPVSVSGMTIDRQCSSGLMAIATAAKQIVIDKMVFSPTETTAAVGDTIEWVNNDILAHTATARNGDWDVAIAARKTGSYVLKKAGSIDYYCRYHPNMTARIVVAAK